MLPMLPASMRRQEEEEESEGSCAVGDNDGGEVEATKKETEVKWGVDDRRGWVPTSSDGALQVPFILIHDIRSLTPFPLARAWLVTSISLLRRLYPTSTQVSCHLNKL